MNSAHDLKSIPNMMCTNFQVQLCNHQFDFELKTQAEIVTFDDSRKAFRIRAEDSNSDHL